MEFFVSSMITSMRESLEAGFAVMILISLLIKKQTSKKTILVVCLSALVGAIAAIGFGIAVHYLNQQFSSNHAFKVSIDTLMLLSAGVLLFWMIFSKHHSTSEVKSKVFKSSSVAFVASLMAFTSVFREGSEIVLFTYKQQDIWGILSGVAIGLVTIIVIFFVTKKIKISILMNVLIVFLILNTSPIVASWTQDVIYPSTRSGVAKLYNLLENDVPVYKKVFVSIGRGFIGLRSSSYLSGLIAQLIWIALFGSLFTFKMMNRKNKRQHLGAARLNNISNKHDF